MANPESVISLKGSTRMEPTDKVRNVDDISQLKFVSSLTIVLMLCICTAGLSAREHKSKVSSAQDRWDSFDQRTSMHETGLFSKMPFRSVGPVVMSGRVIDIEPSPVDPYSFYVAYATGGLWKTENNGMRFSCLFQNINAIAIGDFAVDSHDPKTIWVGTGECNAARSHYSGTGIYKTTDEGKNWKCMGLSETHHIGRVIIHPDDSNTVFLAAMGHLYSNNPERGIYRTKDGGETWEKVLYIDLKTGAIDVIFDPSDPKVLYAATWQKNRKIWNINESGKGSGIYKSTDGGDTWNLMKGFPKGKYIGRIGLAVAPSNPNVVYALLDNLKPKTIKQQYEGSKINARKIIKMTKEQILAIDNSDLKTFIRRSGFHSDYTVEDIRKMLKEDEITVKDIVDYMKKLNPLADDPQTRGAEVYRSDNAGKTWKKMNLTFLDSLYNIAGYYFGEIRVSPTDEDQIYIMGVPLLASDDGGRTYESIGRKGVHVDHHAMWIDPANPEHIINGNDGGLNLTYDRGDTWQKLNFAPVGQFYAVNVDMAEPYNIYGGLQDNGTYKGSSKSVPNETSEWERISGGDGFYIQIADDFTVFCGSQYGYYQRLDTNGKRTRVRPDQPKMDEPSLLCNWQTPILLSTHSPNVLYFGSTRLFRSLDQGENLTPISPAIATPKMSGNVPYGTITTIAESKQTFGVLYFGSDNGQVHCTLDGGFNWQRIDQQLPKKKWVTRIETSNHTDGVIYLSLNGYRNDDFRTFLYASEDFGKNWTSIKSNLPDESVNVIREDPINPNVLYVGTDKGVFVSINKGKSWDVLQNGIPITPSHDLVIHPRDRELVVGTHGRSIYVMNIEPIQKLTDKIKKKAIHLFEPKIVRQKRGSEMDQPSSIWKKADDRTADMYYWLAESASVEINIKDCNDVVARITTQGTRGINLIQWDMVVDRKTELNRRLKKASEELTEAKNKLNQSRKDQKKASLQKAKEIATADSLKEDKSNSEKTKKSQQELRKKINQASKKVKDIKSLLGEPAKYLKLPEKTRQKMIRTVYAAKGDYTVEIKSGDQIETATLKIGSDKKIEKLDTKKKRREETKKLLSEYEVAKK